MMQLGIAGIDPIAAPTNHVIKKNPNTKFQIRFNAGLLK